MTVADNIRALASEARPVIRQAIEAAEILASFSEAAREKGINWTQLKALLVAQEKDANDGGERAKKITEKADIALTYSSMLVGSNVSDNDRIPTQSPAANAHAAGIERPLKRSELSRADKRDEAAPRSPTKRPAAQGKSEDIAPSAPTTSADNQPVATASSQADGNGEAVAPEPADKNAAASTNSPTGSSCPPAGGAVHDKAPHTACTASSFSDDPFNADVRTTFLNRTGELRA